MREIKFRVWDKQDLRMITHEQSFIPLKVCSLGVLRLDPTSEENRYNIIPIERFELMQFTGLLDKNGKEVYKGDILSVKWRVEVYQSVEGTWMVRFKDSKTNKPTSLYDYLKRRLRSGCPEDCEVIGNVYQNPELL